jgi:hypothetical protein
MKSEHATSAKQDEILDRQSKVWSMRVDGMTVREIAAELDCGVATVQRALDAVRAELDESTKFHAETDRAIAAERLDKVARKLIAGIDLVDVPELPSLANAIARIEERKAKLLGLDAASKTELTGAEGGPLQVDARNDLLRKLSSLAARDNTEGETSDAAGEPDA